MKTFRKSIRTASLAAVTCVALISTPVLANSAMGGDQDHHGTSDTDFGKPGDPAQVARTVTLTATDFAFDVQSMAFKKGETVKFVLINKGTQAHELTIASAAEQIEHRKMMQEMAGMDMASMHHNDGNNVSVEPGETKELVWDFTKAGTFEFACNYPGHAEIGMEGKIVVK